MTFVEVTDLRKSFGDKIVLDDIDLAVDKGEFASLLGPSGCGKTTMLRLLAGFDTPDGGTISIDGHRLDGVPSYKRNVGVVFQHYALFPHLTVSQNVAFGLERRRVAKSETARRVGEALEMVRMGEFGGRLPGQLSGGQQQRVALARALVTRPRVLLLDESLGALDKRLRVSMQVELRQIQREVGITTIFVTHDQEEALTMSDRIAVMRDGRIEQFDTPTTVYRQPANAYVAGVVGDLNVLEVDVAGAPGAWQLSGRDGQQVEFRSEAPLTPGPVQIGLRPEDIVLREEAPGVAVPGRITYVSFAGSVALVGVRVLGTDVKVELPAARVADLAVGDDVGVGWDERAMQLYPGTGGAEEQPVRS